MSRRRGILALWLILLMAALITVGAGILHGAGHAWQSVVSQEKGLTAQYAAESGAVWGLAYVKAYGFPESRTVRLNLSEGTACTVRFSPDSTEEAQRGTIYAAGEETATGTMRYVRLTVLVEEETRTVTVEDVRDSRT